MPIGANATPRFTVNPVIGMQQISTANALLDGTGTLATLVTGATNGTRVDFIVIKAAGTVTNGMIRFFVNDGVNTRLIREVSVTAAIPSATVASFYTVVPFTIPDDEQLFILPSAYLLRVSTNNAESFNVFAYGGEF